MDGCHRIRSRHPSEIIAILLMFATPSVFFRILLIPALMTLRAGVPGSRTPPREARESLEILGNAVLSSIPVGKQVLEEVLEPLYRDVRVRPADERVAGEAIAASIANEYRGKLDVDPRDLAYLKAMGRRVAGGARLGSPGFTFHLLEGGTVNAFAHCGGHVYVFRGLLWQLQNEAQLAAILGHEIAHVELGHTQEIVKAWVLAGQVQAVLPLVSVDQARLVAESGHAALRGLYQEVQERDADREGLALAFKAGYDPDEGSRFWRDHPETDRGQGWLERASRAALRSHPPAQERARAACDQAQKLKKADPRVVLRVGADALRQRVPPETP